MVYIPDWTEDEITNKYLDNRDKFEERDDRNSEET